MMKLSSDIAKFDIVNLMIKWKVCDLVKGRVKLFNKFSQKISFLHFVFSKSFSLLILYFQT